MPNILNSLSTKNKIFLLAVIILVAIAIPLTIIQVQKQQEIRQRAAGEDMLLYLANNESCISPLMTLPLTSAYPPLYICLAAGTNKEGISGFNITLSAASLTFSSAEATSQSQAGFDMQIANTTNTLNIRGFIKNIDNNVPVTTSLPLLKFNVATPQNSGNITITTTEITSLKQDAYLTVATSPLSFGTGAAAAPTPTPTPMPTAITTPKPCSGAGYQCFVGSGDQTSGCQLAPTGVFDCTLEGSNGIKWDTAKCFYNCPISTVQPPSTSGTGGFRIEPTPIPSGFVTLRFNVTLPGIAPRNDSILITANIYRVYSGSPLISVSNISLVRQPNSDTFIGTSETKIRKIDIEVNKDYYVVVQAQSYQKELITGGEEKDKPQGLRKLYSDTTLPTVKLLPGDINDSGAIDGVDLGILVACFGKKNVLTDSAGRTTDCSDKTQSRKFDADIDKNNSVDGIDINLWARGSIGIL